MTDFVLGLRLEWGRTMSASVVAMPPLLTMFFIGQRYFIQSVTFAGVEK